MKFGKRLELSLHPLWREKYVSYKKLKRILKRIEYCLQQRKGDKGGAAAGPAGGAAGAVAVGGESATELSTLLVARHGSVQVDAAASTASVGYGTVESAAVLALARYASVENGGPEGEMERILSDAEEREFLEMLAADLHAADEHVAGVLAEARIKLRHIMSAAKGDQPRGNLPRPHSALSSRPSPANDDLPRDEDATAAATAAESRGKFTGGRGNTHENGSGDGDNDNDNDNELGAHGVTVHSEQVFAHVCELYKQLRLLDSFIELNMEGFRKIVKKHDKMLGRDMLKCTFTKTLAAASFGRAAPTVKELLRACEQLCSRDRLLLMHRKHEQWSASNLGVRSPRACYPRNIVICTVPFIVLCVTPIFDDVRAQRTLAMLVYVVMLWVTEALPLFVTALLIPVLTVLLKVCEPPTAPPGSEGALAPATVTAQTVLAKLVDHTTILLLGGYSVAAAFSRCHLEERVAQRLQRLLGHRPLLYMLAVMMMGCWLSMFIGNRSAPILVAAVLEPVIADFSAECRFARALLLGLAFSCNIGGMMSPISSLQNALCISYMAKAGHHISFGGWIMVGIPFCTIAVVVCWVFLCWLLRPTDVQRIAAVPVDESATRWQRRHVAVIGCTVLVTLAWATLSVTVDTFGDLGIISLIFIVLMFGSGLLTSTDFDSFSWHVLFLIGGGNVLGYATEQSGLLTLVVNCIKKGLVLSGPWVLTLQVVLIVTAITTFISHTVAAIVLLPIITHVADSAGYSHIPVMSSALAISASMALPFSSFPNINSLMMQDDFKRPFLHVKDFIRAGLPVTLIMLVLLLSLGYVLMRLVVGL